MKQDAAEKKINCRKSSKEYKTMKIHTKSKGRRLAKCLGKGSLNLYMYYGYNSITTPVVEAWSKPTRSKHYAFAALRILCLS